MGPPLMLPRQYTYMHFELFELLHCYSLSSISLSFSYKYLKEREIGVV